MSIIDTFMRGKNTEGVQISAKTRKEIQSVFLKMLNWNFEDLLQFLKIVGIRNPTFLNAIGGIVSLKDKENGEISLFFNGEMEISLYKSDNFGRRNIEDYEVSKKKPLDKNNVILKKRVIYKDGKELVHSKIDVHPFSCTVGWFDEKYELIVLFDCRNYIDYVRSIWDMCNQNPKILPNMTIQKIYEYLLDPKLELNVEKILEDLIKIVGLSKEDILNSKDIMLSLNEFKVDEYITREKIYIRHGKICEKVKTNKDGETISVSRSGNWHYISPKGYKISFVKGKCKDVSLDKISTVLDKVKLAFSSMEKFEQDL